MRVVVAIVSRITACPMPGVHNNSAALSVFQHFPFGIMSDESRRRHRLLGGDAAWAAGAADWLGLADDAGCVPAANGDAFKKTREDTVGLGPPVACTSYNSCDSTHSLTLRFLLGSERAECQC